jgi:hypothetical protein
MIFNKYRYFLLLIFVSLIYFLVTLVMYHFSMIIGNQGISLNLFGGGDDGFFYWQQALNVARNLDWLNTSIYPLLIGYI